MASIIPTKVSFKNLAIISGMTGTGKVAGKRISDTWYSCYSNPNQIVRKQRIDYPGQDLCDPTTEKVFASLEYVKQYHEKGNPI